MARTSSRRSDPIRKHRIANASRTTGKLKALDARPQYGDLPGVASCFSAAFPVCLFVCLAACGSTPTTTPVRYAGEANAERLPGLAACSDAQPEELEIRPDEPLVLLVHGCFSSGGRFRSLAKVFELKGQQTLCFNYSDRDSISASAAELARVLRWLHKNHGGEITVLGHSQGGLVARLAMARIEPTEGKDGMRLVSVSTPFGGVDAATHCGWLALHVVTLGVTVAICQMITGSDWVDLHPSSTLVRHPEALPPLIKEHIAIVTDERNSCRRRKANGDCDEDDYVFSLGEQTSAALLKDRRARLITIVEGHSAVVGQGGRRPQKLIDVLLREGILRKTPVAGTHAFNQALDRIYR